ncbi:hypothetical protein SAMN02745157_4549 [Kaistia soli DSM 19436]|uniref:Uncharacterized protein n=1 Tax=Kaistia soli DSM 19436 TaxID=1122133 RepID=A0A1M5LBD0_9HYPH|nr:hypothetical protein [Kaistia soli]SHG62318.1 hypothetical protein SAMN02745157_4549 [Kaistia soli DSM 19436]
MSSKSKTPRHIDVKLLKKQIDNDPLAAAEACQGEFADLRDTSRATRSRLVLKSFFIAQAYIADTVLWEDFLSNPYWVHSKTKMKSTKPTVENISRAVMIFVKRAKTVSERKRAYKYASAVTPFLEEDSSPAEVQKALKGGIERLIRKAAKARQSSQAADAQDDASAAATSHVLGITVPLELYQKVIKSRDGELVKLFVRRNGTKNKRVIFDAEKVARVRE